MAYIGILVTLEEAVRLAKTTRSGCVSAMKVYELDKGTCVLGFEMKGYANICDPFVSIESTIVNIRSMVRKWKTDVLENGWDMSSVIITPMECDDIVMENPEPILVHYAYASSTSHSFKDLLRL